MKLDLLLKQKLSKKSFDCSFCDFKCTKKWKLSKHIALCQVVIETETEQELATELFSEDEFNHNDTSQQDLINMTILPHK